MTAPITLPLPPDKAQWLKSKVRDVPNFPKEGIDFKDVTTLMKDGSAFSFLLKALIDHAGSLRPDLIAGLEARGFILAPVISFALGVGFIPIRKPGKLPCAVERVEYALEYGADSLEVHVDAVSKGQRVVVIDDLLATGGTAEAAYRLLTAIGAEVVGLGFAIELNALNGRKKLPPSSEVFSVVQY